MLRLLSNEEVMVVSGGLIDGDDDSGTCYYPSALLTDGDGAEGPDVVVTADLGNDDWELTVGGEVVASSDDIVVTAPYNAQDLQDAEITYRELYYTAVGVAAETGGAAAAIGAAIVGDNKEKVVNALATWIHDHPNWTHTDQTRDVTEFD